MKKNHISSFFIIWVLFYCFSFFLKFRSIWFFFSSVFLSQCDGFLLFLMLLGRQVFSVCVYVYAYKGVFCAACVVCWFSSLVADNVFVVGTWFIGWYLGFLFFLSIWVFLIQVKEPSPRLPSLKDRGLVFPPYFPCYQEFFKNWILFFFFCPFSHLQWKNSILFNLKKMSKERK